jgi:hypothetical protein
MAKGPSTEKLSLYDDEVTLYYNDARHRYEVDIPSENVRKRYVPSATGIKGKLDKSAALTGWGVNTTLAFIETCWLPGLKYTKQQIQRATRKAKRARFDASADATEIGSAAHEWFEDYIGFCIDGVEIEIIDEHDNGQPREAGVLYMPQDPAVRSAVQAFINWVTSHEIEWLWTEKRVYSRKHNFAGTADVAFRLDGKLYLGDFKTSKRIYKDYFLQLAAYAKALEEMGHEKFYGLWTIRVPKDGGGIEIMDNDHIEFFHFNTKRTYQMKLSIAKLFKYFLGLRLAYEFDEEAKDLFGDVVK